MSLKFCIIIESNSQKTFCAIVLYTNMAAVTSHQSKFHQLEIRIRGKFGPYTGLGFRSVIFSLASPWIKINCKGTVMLWFDCRPTLILLKTSSTSRAVFWLLVESRIYKENKNNTVNWVAIASQTSLRAISQTSRTAFYTPRPWNRPGCIFYFRTIALSCEIRAAKRTKQKISVFGLLTQIVFIVLCNTFNPLTAERALRALLDFTLSNARRFYSSMGNPLDGKGLKGS